MTLLILIAVLIFILAIICFVSAFIIFFINENIRKKEEDILYYGGVKKYKITKIILYVLCAMCLIFSAIMIAVLLHMNFI